MIARLREVPDILDRLERQGYSPSTLPDFYESDRVTTVVVVPPVTPDRPCRVAVPQSMEEADWLFLRFPESLWYHGVNVVLD